MLLLPEEAWPLALATLVLVGVATALLWRRFTARVQLEATTRQPQYERGRPSLGEQLPDEIVLHILSFLGSGHDLAAASAACSRWHQVASEPQLWAELLCRQFPTAWADQAPTPASVLRWCAVHRFPAHLRPSVQMVEHQAREQGTIDWRTLYAVELQASSSGAAAPRRKAGGKWRFRTTIVFRTFCRPKRLVMLGNDNAGKTTLAHVLQYDQVRLHPPSCHPHLETVTLEGERYSLVDLSCLSQRSRRAHYLDYLQGASGVVYVVDASDRERFEEARTLLEEVLEWLRENHLCMPLLVLGNKIDVPRAVSEQTLKAALNLGYCCTGKEAWELKQGVQPVEVFMCSVVRRVGVGAGFRWLTAYCN